MHHRLLLLLTAISSILVKAPYGFSVDLVHRHSPLSPFYNASLVSSEILRKNAIHSMHQVELLQSSIKDNVAKSIVVPSDQGFYLMNLSFGTPPVEYFAIVDTTTDLTWIQCVPCTRCYSQGSSLFDPEASSTYQAFSCDSQICQALSGEQCFKTNDCQYNITYPEGSSTLGILSSDTLSIDSENGEKIAFPMSIFGCGRNNQVNFGHPGFAGIVGLGGGPFSLISQKATQINYRFSYCFAPDSAKSSGKLIFGQESITSRPGSVSTPLVSNYPQSFYYLTLEGVTVGNKTAWSSSSQGNVVIASAITLTILEQDLYNGVEAMVKDAIVEKPVQDPSGTFNLCYVAGTNINVPEMVFHFTGADIRLRPINTFQVNGNLVCMMIVPTNSNPSVFGSYAQVNFQVEYDLQNRTVSFAPTDCVGK
ncbi:Detected protein of unknown function [Hibiscus syriacus]|uniref:Peptidase A1 domain-containing protein n=1 Tax=Hibiscus syriacus TaxID=106335 RepID=A0A6A3ABM9_HIBSY|nr:aspartic proteinase CDR1-like [Hibiscus syriacus]KAE8701518.1 Detected protein of unknown function [Hibiscus syriacus]